MVKSPFVSICDREFSILLGQIPMGFLTHRQGMPSPRHRSTRVSPSFTRHVQQSPSSDISLGEEKESQEPRIPGRKLSWFHGILPGIWLVVYRPTPLKNDGVKVSWGDDIPNIWKNKIHVPNHQPVSERLGESPHWWDHRPEFGRFYGRVIESYHVFASATRFLLMISSKRWIHPQFMQSL